MIGGGSAGLFATYYAGMRNMKTKMIDNLPKLGGTITVFYPDKYIYDVGGIARISGRDLIEQSKEQAFMFDPTVVSGQAVDDLEKKEDGTFELTTSNGQIHHSKTVIIAAGPGLFKARRTHGYRFDLEPIKSWGFTLEKRRIPVNENMETQLPGVYAAGDIAGYPKKWRLIASAYNEAITAVNSAKVSIDPSAPAQVYSSILLDE